jgi:hypothetical protein
MTKLSTSSTIAMETACRARIGSNVGRRRPTTAARPPSLGGRIHERRPALRQAQGARAVKGAGASPGRELADAVAGDHSARRPGRAKRGPHGQGLHAAQQLPREVGEQVCRSGCPDEATGILPQHTGRSGEDRLGLRAVRDEVEHGGVLTALPGA